MPKSFFNNQPGEEPSGPIPELEPDSDLKSGQSEDSFKTEEGRLAAVMAYIPFLCFIPLLNMKENKEARFHARQGVMLFLIELVAVVFLIDNFSDFIFKAILIVAAAFSVAGIYFALQGKNYRLPIIGDLADKSKL
ncbi:MAG: hypothetical protein PHU88_00590 [candidate division Zixibacteria bacterium]|nr:hypothetical protein [candidate division Zixibacteria bacterium]MDD5425418.1 hypothetical protein [candidate division Zixibacteria bacterium]